MDDEYVELQILDAAGKRLFREILDGKFFPIFSFFFNSFFFFFFPLKCSEFYQVVEGIVVVYDMTSADSFGG